MTTKEVIMHWIEFLLGLILTIMSLLRALHCI
jgi:hypothetical protein